MSNPPGSGVASEASRSVFQHLTDKRASFFAFLRKRVDSLETAEDLLQAAYLHAIEHLKELRDERRADAWFYRLLRNAIIDHYRRAATAAKVLVQETTLDRSVEPLRPANPCPCAIRELARLKASYARALEEVEMDGMSVQVFASNKKIAPGTASVRLHRARRALASRLQTICGSCSGEGCFDCICT
jgi:RNA polymerase sigma-70 factor (ECF subfamily)